MSTWTMGNELIVEHCIEMVECLDNQSGDEYDRGVRAAIEVLKDILEQTKQGN